MQFRISYRVRQFWRAIFVKNDEQALARARARLNPTQWALFDQLQPADKNHAIIMFYKLLEQGDDQPDVLVAALLHDIGKLRYRQNPIERAVVVLIKAISPEQARSWGNLPAGGWDSLPGWRKAFIMAEQHAYWGAELARQAGVSPVAVALISQHHRTANPEEGEAFNHLLGKLWMADNEN